MNPPELAARRQSAVRPALRRVQQVPRAPRRLRRGRHRRSDHLRLDRQPALNEPPHGIMSGVPGPAEKDVAKAPRREDTRSQKRARSKRLSGSPGDDDHAETDWLASRADRRLRCGQRLGAAEAGRGHPDSERAGARQMRRLPQATTRGGCRASRTGARRPENWERTIKRMVSSTTSTLEPADARDILKYLADHTAWRRKKPGPSRSKPNAG